MDISRLLFQVIDEHKDMESAMSNLVDVKHNEQELEDELADLLSEDEPPNVSNTDKHRFPGIVLIIVY